MKWLHLFTAHPASVNETYLEHLCTAAGFSLRMIAGGAACLVHALLPFLFVNTGSDCVKRLHGNMMSRRNARMPSAVSRSA